MMKTLLTIALLLFASFYYSQSYYASYQEKFTIEVAEDDVHTYRVYLNMASLDTTINHVGISMTKEEKLWSNICFGGTITPVFLQSWIDHKGGLKII